MLRRILVNTLAVYISSIMLPKCVQSMFFMLLSSRSVTLNQHISLKKTHSKFIFLEQKINFLPRNRYLPHICSLNHRYNNLFLELELSLEAIICILLKLYFIICKSFALIYYMFKWLFKKLKSNFFCSLMLKRKNKLIL